MDIWEAELGDRIVLHQSICHHLWPHSCDNRILLDDLSSSKVASCVVGSFSLRLIDTFCRFRCEHFFNFFFFKKKLCFNVPIVFLPLLQSSCRSLQTFHQYLAVVIQLVVACKNSVLLPLNGRCHLLSLRYACDAGLCIVRGTAFRHNLVRCCHICCFGCRLRASYYRFPVVRVPLLTPTSPLVVDRCWQKTRAQTRH